MTNDPQSYRGTMATESGDRSYIDLPALAGDRLDELPYSIRVLLEAAARKCDGSSITSDDIENILNWARGKAGQVEIPFAPGRVILQDFTGVPAVVDLAAMRDAIVRMTGDPDAASLVNPLVPCDLVIDHSVQVDAFASGEALTINGNLEFERNGERYRFLKWGQQAFDNFRVVPPAMGIVHQVNLEHLATVVMDDGSWIYPDSLVGTDSHTTMINGLGVVGWGVGGIEAEAVMLGQAVSMVLPEVIGMRLTGELPKEATATDMVLRITELLRAEGVVSKFVEFFGPGLTAMPLANRATIANMAPEYGATMGFFPVDERTVDYMLATGRSEELCSTVEQCCKAQGLWHDPQKTAKYTKVLELDLAKVKPSLAGPRRPQDRVDLSEMQSNWRDVLVEDFNREIGESRTADAQLESGAETLRDGSVVIAAITSCTNTSNPSVMMAAGILAQKLVARGLRRKPWVKTSLAPGSRVVTSYLESAGLMDGLESLGFHTVGYGCTTCIGNSGPLPDPIRDAIHSNDLVACSVLSGNRNFEGRIGADIRANWLASPPLVVAYAVAGTVDIDLESEPIGVDSHGDPVMLSEVWPTPEEVDAAVRAHVRRDQFETEYATVFEGSDAWRAIEVEGGARYQWDEASTYIQNPPFFADLGDDVSERSDIEGARVLAKLSDSVTTDHISPAGVIKKDSPAGQWLVDRGVPVSMFNSYGSRRGNDRIMTRGTFANVRVRNELAPGTEGGYTTDFTTGKVTSIYEAASASKDAGTPLIVLAGKDYGMGSSRDWAAKGTFLLGVKAVIAESFERIHRSNLVGMGVLPLCFGDGESSSSLDLTGHEVFDIRIPNNLTPGCSVSVRATKEDGTTIDFIAVCRLDTPVEVGYWNQGGILHTVLRRIASTHLAEQSS
ncbi:MAG TPA: aconitate hydratase AcnA [Phycisphaerales bacterium]|nr:aconitate hydratase AcnA [Phycisphaerales bacterium]